MTTPELFTLTWMERSDGSTGFGGVPEDSWTEHADVPIYGVAPTAPDLTFTTGRNVAQIPLYVLADADELGDVKPRDLFVWLGDQYVVDGYPENFNYGPFGFEPGVRIAVVRQEG